MTYAIVATAAPRQLEEFDVTPGQPIIVLGWTYYSHEVWAVYAEADGYVRTIPAHLLRVTPHDGSDDRIAA